MIRPHVDRLKRWQELKVKIDLSVWPKIMTVYFFVLSLILESMLRKSSKTSMLQIQTFIPFQE